MTSTDFSFWKTLWLNWPGKTMGIIGFGRIGLSRGRDSHLAFQMRIIVADEVRSALPHRPNFRWCEVDELLDAGGCRESASPATPRKPRELSTRRP